MANALDDDDDETWDDDPPPTPSRGGPGLTVLTKLRASVSPAIQRQLLRRLTTAATRLGLGAGDRAGIRVAIVDDATIADLNRKHMGKRGPTDVLSFPARPPGPEASALAAMGVPLGDIVLSWDAVVRQAVARGRGDITCACMEDATVLLIHGLCHLTGDDHATRRDGRTMHRHERRSLRAVRVADIPRPYGLHPQRGTGSH